VTGIGTGRYGGVTTSGLGVEPVTTAAVGAPGPNSSAPVTFAANGVETTRALGVPTAGLPSGCDEEISAPGIGTGI